MSQPIAVLDATWAGTDPHAVYRLQFGEISPPHSVALAEMPAVGPNATGLGKIAGIMSQPWELRPYGWQLQTGQRITNKDQLRARSHLHSTIQALSDVAQDRPVTNVTVRLQGPIATMTTGMLPSGQRIIGDHGARQHVVEAWAEGTTQLATTIEQILGATTTVLVEEHSAQQAIEGTLRTVAGADVERALDRAEVVEAWELLGSLEPTVLIDTTQQLHPIAAANGSIITQWPTGRTQHTEDTWQRIAQAVDAHQPVGVRLQDRTDAEYYAEELIDQYVDWGLPLAGLGHVRMIQSITHEHTELQAGRRLQHFQATVNHAAQYANRG